MEIGGRMPNMCLSLLMVETYEKYSLCTNQGLLRRTVARVGKSCQKTSPTDATDVPLVNRWGIDATVNIHL